MKKKTNNPKMYINKNNEIMTMTSSKKRVSDSCIITGNNNTPLCQIDLICFDAKSEALQMAKFRQIITFLMENKII
jgi:hypothetical protein